MQTPLVGTGGSNGVRVLGDETNSNFTNNILKLADADVRRATASVKAKQYIEGKARVAQGESYQGIKQNQGVFDKIFGSATLLGAKAQNLIQLNDKHVLDMQESRYDNRDIPTETFVQSQNDYVTDNLLTGDPDIDNLVVISAAESISTAAKVQAQDHALWIQENAKFTYESTLSMASQRSSARISDPTVSNEVKMEELLNLQQRSMKLPGQHEAAYIASMRDVILDELKHDRPLLYNAFTQGSVDINGNVVATGNPMAFSVEDNTAMQVEFAKHRERIDVKAAIEHAQGRATMEIASKDPSIDTDVLIKDYIDPYLKKNGANDETTAYVASLLIDSGAARLKDDKMSRKIANINDGSSPTDTEREGYTEAYDLWLNLGEAEVMKKPPQEQDDARAKFLQSAITKTLADGIVPGRWKRNHIVFDSLLNRGGVNDGKASEAFIKAMPQFIALYERGQAGNGKNLFASTESISEQGLSNFLAVRNRMQVQGWTAEEAVNSVAADQIPPVEAAKYVLGSEFKAKIDEAKSNVDSSWMGWISNTPVRNPLEFDKLYEQAIKHNIGRTGQLGDTAFLGAQNEMKKNTEIVDGYVVYTGGQSIQKRMQLSDPSVTVDDALNHFMQVTMKERNVFGPGFESQSDTSMLNFWDSKNYQLKFNGNFVTITPTTKDGMLMDGLNNLAVTVSFADIGREYNTDVTKTKIHDAAVEGAARKKKDVLLSLYGMELTSQQVGSVGSSIMNNAKGLMRTVFPGIAKMESEIEMVKGGAVVGSENDHRIYEKLHDPVTGPKIKSMLRTIVTQTSQGNMEGVNQSIGILAELSGFDSEDEAVDFGTRADGSKKGSGFLGTLLGPDGNISTELSVGVSFDGKEMEIPSLVPTLDKEEIALLMSGAKPTQAIMDKAIAHAKMRMQSGKSVFSDEPPRRSDLIMKNFVEREDVQLKRNYDDPQFWASHGAARYNASTPTEQKNWISNGLKGMRNYFKGAITPEQKKNIQELHDTLDEVASAFTGEMQKVGLSLDQAKLAMTQVYFAETNASAADTESDTGVTGALQVTTKTYRDLMTTGILGDKAAVFLGFANAADMIKKTDPSTKSGAAAMEKLRSANTGSFVGGFAKILQTLMTRKRKQR